MDRILIAYFSHEGEAYVGGKIVELEEGNTKAAARMIQAMTGAEMFRIEPVTPYPHDHMETIEVAKKEQQADARPPYKGKVADMESYSTILLGYPNWWGTMPQIVMTFLEDYDLTGKTILPLCTNEGSGMGSSEKDLKQLVPGAVIGKGLSIQGGKVARSEKDIQRWLQKNHVI
ncbi:flavodoxin [Dysosmobacter welbionis]|uniref:flavodoxin n=1 Tax=Dysosmobacter welbionis TaxID=2093857 RepID=UPI0032C0BDB8